MSDVAAWALTLALLAVAGAVLFAAVRMTARSTAARNPTHRAQESPVSTFRAAPSPEGATQLAAVAAEAPAGPLLTGQTMLDYYRQLDPGIVRLAVDHSYDVEHGGLLTDPDLEYVFRVARADVRDVKRHQVAVFTIAMSWLVWNGKAWEFRVISSPDVEAASRQLGVESGSLEALRRILQRAHTRLSLTGEHFDRVAAFVRRAALQLGMPESHADALVSVVGTFRPDVVTVPGTIAQLPGRRMVD